MGHTSLRRTNTTPDVPNYGGGMISKQSSSFSEASRKSSIAGLSLRLTKSKRTNSSITFSENRANRLGELFFSLPGEIQTQIFCYFDLGDIFSLRLTSSAAKNAVNNNAFALSKAILSESPTSGHHREYFQSLYRQPIPCLNTDYLLSMLHRQSIIDRTVQTIVNFIQMKIYMIRSASRLEQFCVYRDRLQNKLYKPAWTIYHYIDSYRNIVMYEHTKHAQSRFWECSQCAEAIEQLVATYPSEELMPAFQFYQLVIVHLKASSRAPTYAGTLERTFRRWNRKPPSENELAQMVIMGGLYQMSRVSIMKGTFTQRLETIGSFTDKLQASAKQFALAFGPSARMGVIIDEKDGMNIKQTGVMSRTDTPYEDVTEQVLESLPAFSDFLIPEWTKRIVEEQLVDDEQELTNPFKYVQKIMMDDGDGREPEAIRPNRIVQAFTGSGSTAAELWRPDFWSPERPPPGPSAAVAD